MCELLQEGKTPLLVASERNDDKVIDALIEGGADVNIADKVSYYQPTYVHVCLLCAKTEL